MKPKILDLIDFAKVDTLLEGFNKSTGFVTAILDLDGNVLSKSGWRQMCTEFHRVNPETSKLCTISDTVLANKMAEGEKYHFYQCLNGLVDVAVPIVIKGEHIANLFSGQFFFEKPDESFFHKQAMKYGFKQENYLKALEKVPVVSEEKVKVAMDFLLNMTRMISEMTFQKMEQMEMNDALIKSNLLTHSIIDNSTSLIYLFDTDGKVQLVNSRFESLFNTKKDEMTGKLREAFMPAEIALQHRNNDLEIIKSKQSITFEEQNIEPDGKHFYLTQKFPLFDSNKEVYAVGGISTDITERKRAEIALKRSEGLLNETQCLTKVGSWEWDLKTDKIWWSDETYEVFGVNHQNFVPDFETNGKFIHPDDFERYGKAFENSFQTGEPLFFELRLISEDGKLKYCQTRGKLIYDDSQQPVRFIGTIMDNTESKKAEDELRINNTHLLQAQKIGKIGSFEYFIAENKVNWSDEMYKIFGCENQGIPLTYEQVLEMVHPDDRRLHLEQTQKIKDQGYYSFEHRIVFPNGEIHWLFGKAQMEYHKNGLPFRMLGTVQDITERKQEEEELLKAKERSEESEIKYRNLFQHMEDGFLQADMNGVITLANNAMAKMFDYNSPDEMLGMLTLNLFSNSEERAALMKEIEAYKKIDNYEILAKTKKGNELWVLGNYKEIYNQKGERIGTEGLFRDITERKQAEEKNQNQLNELKRYNSIMVDREIKMIQLKQEINNYCRQLNLPEKYSIPTKK